MYIYIYIYVLYKQICIPSWQDRLMQASRVSMASSLAELKPARAAGSTLPHRGPSKVAVTRLCGSPGDSVSACSTAKCQMLRKICGTAMPEAVQG